MQWGHERREVAVVTRKKNGPYAIWEWSTAQSRGIVTGGKRPLGRRLVHKLGLFLITRWTLCIRKRRVVDSVVHSSVTLTCTQSTRVSTWTNIRFAAQRTFINHLVSYSQHERPRAIKMWLVPSYGKLNICWATWIWIVWDSLIYSWNTNFVFRNKNRSSEQHFFLSSRRELFCVNKNESEQLFCLGYGCSARPMFS